MTQSTLHPLAKRKPQGLRKYDEEIALEVCAQLARGATLDRACSGEGRVPSQDEFLYWTLTEPELAKAVSAAKSLSAFSLEEEAITAARKIARKDGKLITAQEARAIDILIKQLQWSAERRNPAQFSSKASVSLTVPIQINTGLDLGTGGDGKGSIGSVYEMRSIVGVDPDEAAQAAADGSPLPRAIEVEWEASSSAAATELQEPVPDGLISAEQIAKGIAR